MEHRHYMSPFVTASTEWLALNRQDFLRCVPCPEIHVCSRVSSIFKVIILEPLAFHTVFSQSILLYISFSHQGACALLLKYTIKMYNKNVS